MKRFGLLLALVALSGLPALAAALGTSARTVIPSEIQQVISVDYRALKNSPTALALKDRVLPDNLKEFETALRGVGINPDTDVEQLTFASFRAQKNVRIIGLAAGNFPTKKILAKLTAKKVKGTKYHSSTLYPMAGGTDMTFLDDFTMLFGQRAAVENALDARDGEAPSMANNAQMSDMMGSVESGAVWSILDAQGTQNMMRSTLGDAAKLADFDTVKNRLLGSHYTMNFQNGVNFDLDVVTADSITAATLSSIVKAGVLFRKMSAQGAEKTALDNVTVDSDSSNLQLHFKTDDNKFQSLLKSDLFASIAR